MPTSLRKLGVHGKNAPVKATKVVQASPFNIGGVIGQFERKYAQAFLVENPIQELQIFGDFYDSTTYGKDTTKLFWNNLGGNSGQLYIKAHVGYNGSEIDAVVASLNISDQNGLMSAITLANEIKLDMNAHAADLTRHAAADTTNFPLTEADADDLSSLLTLTNAIITAYTGHDTDALLASGWAFHVAQESPSNALTSTAVVTDITTAVARLNDIKSKFNAHDTNSTTHTSTANHQVSATNASSTQDDTLLIKAAYRTVLEYGTSGNRSGVTIENGIRYATTLASAMLTSATSAVVTSVIGIHVGDIVTIRGTGATPGVINRKVLTIDESTNTITWSGTAGITGEVDDSVEVPGFKIHTWRKSQTGIVQEVETQLGSIWCTMEPEVTQYYAPTVHEQNNWIYVSNASSTSTRLEAFPDEGSTVEYLAGGANGTAPTTSTHWDYDLAAFDGKPIRFLTNCETADVTTQKNLETYCRNRDDTPIGVTRIAENQTYAQLTVIGSRYQRSNDVYQVVVADWLQVTDPYNNAPNAPNRVVPNVGLVMGAWLQSISVAGIHVIPCTDQIALNGINGLENSNLGDVDDDIRTQLAEYGVNLIQFINGSGYRIRNLFTPSTATAYMFANGILMRNFIKISAEDSLQSSENTPNSFNRILEDKNALLAFLYRLWFVGSTGNVPTGETFGQQQNDDGTLTDFSDHVQVIADAINNPLSSINLGERNIDVYFTYPAPAGSIEINVGILIR
jgi:hypothetical protein